jgi:hypothetical protein
MNRLLGALLTLALVFGVRFYNKYSAAKDVKTRLTSLCEGDSACIASVDAHFDECFDHAYSVAEKKQGEQQVAQALVTCLNTRSDEPYFVASRSKGKGQ